MRSGGYSRAGTALQKFYTMNANVFYMANGSNMHNGKNDLVPVMHTMPDSPRGESIKGLSSMIRVTTIERRPGIPLTKSTPGDQLVIGNSFVVPWNGTVPMRDLPGFGGGE